MTDGWPEVPLGDLVVRVTEKNALGLDRAMTVSARHGLVGQEEFFTKRVASRDMRGYSLVQPGDYVYNKSYSVEAPIGVVARNSHAEPGVVSPLYIVFRPATDLLTRGFLDLAVKSSAFAESLRGLLKEGARAHGALNVKPADFFTAKVPVPPLPVQRRIVDLVEVVDAHIGNLGSEHTALTATVRGLRESFIASMQGNADWVEFSSVTEDVRRPLEVEEQASYSQIGIRSHGRGVFGKEAVTGKTLGAKKMLTVRAGDLVFNIVFAWEGAVAVVPSQFDGWASSHRFPTFRRVDGGSEEFLRQFFLSGQGLTELLLASPGGAGRNRTLGRSALGRILIPQIPREQEGPFVEAITAVEEFVGGVLRERDSLLVFRGRLLQSLLDRESEIASGYDELLDAGVA